MYTLLYNHLIALTPKQNAHKATHQQGNATKFICTWLKNIQCFTIPIKCPSIHTVSFLTFGTLRTNIITRTCLHKRTQTCQSLKNVLSINMILQQWHTFQLFIVCECFHFQSRVKRKNKDRNAMREETDKQRRTDMHSSNWHCRCLNLLWVCTVKCKLKWVCFIWRGNDVRDVKFH